MIIDLTWCGRFVHWVIQLVCGSGVAGILFAMETSGLFDCSSCQNVIMYVIKASYGL